ncbi:MAG: bifunctional hydroxymethylpyrimidine kinase/phosphomethylpyrimidine kinase [Candidatus Scalindua sp. AMX11]|nr:MAG: bifunctional hydroxymethylpyrimidine kinase/phosphomethylpyrimidine kinase [Candidatus Scalindua sp.]NOG84055.1 bifunctional hydroxymethylpyrimidine kinase/phosphomethylpyrimidine kinase [Planctomycetota bacterium]RZV67442.1 MAG: bifunctional hydroxymethylpyrimidine kinase/phosphomethylpyrimidine kinase [Candidatus Scalindua sp. SCAELEC01]TDE63676.1 MAG: bifunctional hydroxymethylpyrimidine kinase/phosphomethylpyrimidine kinase [Candidatus Scalindua sp. AMX11]GJQ60565.1 MAG: hydroxymeth
MYKVLTVAGSDSCCGAGVQADLKTINAFGVYGVCAITAVTAQNTVGVRSIFEVPAQFVGEQMDMVISDIGVDSVKTGMLANEAIVEAVSDRIRRHNLKKVVVDPIVRSHKGSPLLSQDGIRKLRLCLLPEAYLIMPNIPEAEIITGRKIRNFSDVKDAAKSIYELGAQNVLVKGGHAFQPASDGVCVLKSEIVDLLYDGNSFESFRVERIDTENVHGTGCVYSAAIAAELAKGCALKKAVTLAKSFVTKVITESLQLGSGYKLIV